MSLNRSSLALKKWWRFIMQCRRHITNPFLLNQFANWSPPSHLLACVILLYTFKFHFITGVRKAISIPEKRCSAFGFLHHVSISEMPVAAYCSYATAFTCKCFWKVFLYNSYLFKYSLLLRNILLAKMLRMENNGKGCRKSCFHSLKNKIYFENKIWLLLLQGKLFH